MPMTDPPAPLEDGDDDAVGGTDRQQVHDRRLERDHHRPEHRHEQQEGQDDHGDDHPRQSVRQVIWRRRRRAAVSPPTNTVSSRARRRPEDDGAPQSRDELRGLGRLGCRGRIGDDYCCSPIGVDLHRSGEGDPGLGPYHGVELVHGGHVGRRRQGGGDDERAVEARAEPLRQQVEGLARGQRRRVVAGVGEGQAHGEQRDGQSHQHQQGHDACRPRAPLDHPTPAMPEAIGCGRGPGLQAAWAGAAGRWPDRRSRAWRAAG